MLVVLLSYPTIVCFGFIDARYLKITARSRIDPGQCIAKLVRVQNGWNVGETSFSRQRSAWAGHPRFPIIFIITIVTIIINITTSYAGTPTSSPSSSPWSLSYGLCKVLTSSHESPSVKDRPERFCCFPAFPRSGSSDQVLGSGSRHLHMSQ